mmetsp:Transcript_5490/g.13394  ORF Transcript_5490/g.13394 Transcript_5490/m.13394 type:complete len:319 (-) Transcript_5490:1047-2003(-)
MGQGRCEGRGGRGSVCRRWCAGGAEGRSLRTVAVACRSLAAGGLVGGLCVGLEAHVVHGQAVRDGLLGDGPLVEQVAQDIHVGYRLGLHLWHVCGRGLGGGLDVDLRAEVRLLGWLRGGLGRLLTLLLAVALGRGGRGLLCGCLGLLVLVELRLTLGGLCLRLGAGLVGSRLLGGLPLLVGGRLRGRLQLLPRLRHGCVLRHLGLHLVKDVGGLVPDLLHLLLLLLLLQRRDALLVVLELEDALVSLPSRARAVVELHLQRVRHEVVHDGARRVLLGEVPHGLVREPRHEDVGDLALHGVEEEAVAAEAVEHGAHYAR